jgi:hypothetical protein
MRENYPDFLCMKCNAHICCLYFMTSNPGILQAIRSATIQRSTKKLDYNRLVDGVFLRLGR